MINLEELNAYIPYCPFKIERFQNLMLHVAKRRLHVQARLKRHRRFFIRKPFFLPEPQFY